MQPFDPFRRNPYRAPKQSAGRGLGYADPSADSPSFNEVIREMGLILLACLGLAAVFELVSRLAGTH